MYALDNVGRNTIAMVPAGGKGERLSPQELMSDFPPPCQTPEGNKRIQA